MMLHTFLQFVMRRNEREREKRHLADSDLFVNRNIIDDEEGEDASYCVARRTMKKNKPRER